jgi:hypothetical protein
LSISIFSSFFFVSKPLSWKLSIYLEEFCDAEIPKRALMGSVSMASCWKPVALIWAQCLFFWAISSLSFSYALLTWSVLFKGASFFVIVWKLVGLIGWLYYYEERNSVISVIPSVWSNLKWLSDFFVSCSFYCAVVIESEISRLDLRDVFTIEAAEEWPSLKWVRW